MERSPAIRIIPFARFQALLTSFLGLIAGILYSFGGLVVDMLVSLDWITSSETPGLSVGTLMAFGALIGRPVIFAAFGFALGLVEAICFNLFAGWFGGMKTDLFEH